MNKLSCKYFVIDDFYKNPMEVREFALKQRYYSHRYHPGKRTNPLYNEDIENYFKLFFNYYDSFDFKFDKKIMFNFQYNTSEDISWIHKDPGKWSAIIFLTPDAPLSGGTGLYKFNYNDVEKQDNTNTGDCMELKYGQDERRWTLIDSIGNKFNRMVIFKSDEYHKSLDYFGSNIYDGRLMQIFFF